jgi:hypothetical protein
MTTAPLPTYPVQVERRAAELMLGSTDLHYDAALSLAAAEIAEEEARTADSRRRAQEFTDSFEAMTRCPVPGCRHALGGHTGLCERHSLVLRTIEAEAIAAEVLPDGRTVRGWVAELVAERAAR